jgi:hypothetical protein
VEHALTRTSGERDRDAMNWGTATGPRRSGTNADAISTSLADSAARAPNAWFGLSPPVNRLVCTLFRRTGRVFQCRGRRTCRMMAKNNHQETSSALAPV